MGTGDDAGADKRVPFDEARFAFWERFEPYVRDSADWQAYRALIAEGIPDTLAKRMRYMSLLAALRQVRARGVIGHVAECGCGPGDSTRLLAQALEQTEFAGTFFVFDSFEGLPAAAPEDLDVAPGHADLFGVQRDLRARTGQFAGDLPGVRARLVEFPFVRLMKGWIPERFEDVADSRFSFVSVDVDLFAPTRDSLAFFYPRLADGGVIHVDDYNIADWPGCTRAVDEFLAAERPAFFYPVPLGGAVIVK